MIAILIALTGAAFSASPWVAPPGVWSLYGGASQQSFSNYVGGSNNESSLSSPVSETSAQVFASLGLYDGMGMEIDVPLKYVASKLDETTLALGNVRIQQKFRLANEDNGSPVTVSLLAGLRTGAAHAESRGRLTNAGDGTTDVGGGLSFGKYSLGSKGPWWFSGSAQYWWRYPHDNMRDVKVPGDDLTFDAEAVVSVHERVGLGLVIDGFHRTSGADIGENAQYDINKWAALQATNVYAGGKAFVFLPENQTLVLGLLTTAYARNNPTDTLMVSAGYSFYFDGR
jgi:hypothetical protein